MVQLQRLNWNIFTFNPFSFLRAASLNMPREVASTQHKPLLRKLDYNTNDCNLSPVLSFLLFCFFFVTRTLPYIMIIFLQLMMSQFSLVSFRDSVSWTVWRPLFFLQLCFQALHNSIRQRWRDNVSEPPESIHPNIAQNVEIIETQTKWGDEET